MRKERMFTILVLMLGLVSVITLPQGFAKNFVNGPTVVNVPILGVSNPSGACGSLGLKGYVGNIAMAGGKLHINLVKAGPNSAYNIQVGYVSSAGVCDGTWKPFGSINTDQSGTGLLTHSSNLPSNHQDVLEFTDGSGNVVFATPLVST